MNVVVGSVWRSSEHNVPRYLNQIEGLKALTREDHTIRVLAVEGDSIDGTLRALQAGATQRDLELVLVKFDQNTPHFGSTENPARMSALSELLNHVLDHVDDETEVFIYVESDLIWAPATLANLVNLIEQGEAGMDVIAPMIYAGEHFYDVWGFRKSGERFGPFPPYHSELKSSGITEVESVGSCLAMRAEVAWDVRVKNGNALVGWCHEVRQQGYRIGVHRNLEVRHPA